MIALEKARAQLEHLGLAQAAAVLDSRLEEAAQKQLPYADFLDDLLGAEVAARLERYLTTRTRLAHLPFQRTLEQFDFGFQPSIDERQVRELASLSFIAQPAADRASRSRVSWHHDRALASACGGAGCQRGRPEWAEEELRSHVMTKLVRRYGVGYKALLVAMADYGLVTGVESWHAVWLARQLMDAYYDRWNLLRDLSSSAD